MHRNHRAALWMLGTATAAAAASVAGRQVGRWAAQRRAENSAIPQYPEPGDLYFDRRRRRWVFCIDTGAGWNLVALNVRRRKDLDAAVDEAIEFACAGCPEVIEVLEDHDFDEHGVLFDDYEDRWVLWFACDVCGGCPLGLPEDSADLEVDARLDADRIVRHLYDNPGDCPGCIALELRHVRDSVEIEEDEILSWYDPVSLQWQMTFHVEDIGRVTVPLGLESVLLEDGELDAAAATIKRP
jgi:hypothetical protein